MLHGNIREIQDRIHKKIDRIIWWFVAAVIFTGILCVIGKFSVVLTTAIKIALLIAAGVTTVATAVIFGCILGFWIIVKMLDKILNED